MKHLLLTLSLANAESVALESSRQFYEGVAAGVVGILSIEVVLCIAFACGVNAAYKKNSR